MATAKPDPDAEATPTEETAGVETQSYENGEVLDVPNINSHVVGVTYVAPPEPKTEPAATGTEG